MAVKKKYVFTYPNAPYADSTDIAFSEILCVKRGGLQYDEIEGAPTGRQVQYVPGTGRLNFDPLIFDGVFAFGRFVPERILVIYKQ